MIGSYLVGIASSITANAIDRRLSSKPGYFQKQKIDAKINEIVVAIMEPLTAFLEHEGLERDQIEYLSNGAEKLIIWLLENEDFAASRGLDGEQITLDLLRQPGPPSVTEFVESNPAAFERILRAFVDLVVNTPPVFENWEKTSFQTIFRQTEEMKATLASVYGLMTEVSVGQKPASNLFERLVNHKSASTALRTSIHGLRQSAVPQAELDELFVFPEFRMVSSSVSYGTDPGRELDQIQVVDKKREFLNLIDSNNSVIIQAPAGAGKTTFSHWISLQLLRKDNPLFPILVQLRKVSSEDEIPGLLAFAKADAPAAFNDLFDNDQLLEWAAAGRVLLICEGFDEVSESSRSNILQWVKGLSVAYEGIKILLTSRPLSTDHLDELVSTDWTNLELLPFDVERVTEYIEKFQRHGPEIQTGAEWKDASALAETWMNDATLSHLTGNPLLLSTLLIVHHMDGELPDDRSKLYERYIDGMLGLWELNKEPVAPKVPLSKEQKKKILEIIAVNLIEAEVETASESKVFDWLESYLEEQRIEASVKEILDHLRERSGLLIGPGQYSFAHKSIGEFLVAHACNDGVQRSFSGQRYDRKLLAEKCLSDRWTYVVFLWAGLASKIEAQQFVSDLISEAKFELAAGLIYERRKMLERKWVSDEFWRILQLNSDEAVSDDDDLFLKIGNGPAAARIGEKQLKIRRLTTPLKGLLDETDLIIRFFADGICDPNEWHLHLSSLNASNWVLFAWHVDPTKPFFDAAPDTLKDEAKCFIFALKPWLTHLKPRGGYRPEAAMCDSDLFDVLAFLSVLEGRFGGHGAKKSHERFAEIISEPRISSLLDNVLSIDVQKSMPKLRSFFDEEYGSRTSDDPADSNDQPLKLYGETVHGLLSNMESATFSRKQEICFFCKELVDCWRCLGTAGKKE